MRHVIIEEPFSRPARWSPKVAWFGLAVACIASLMIRFRLIEYDAGFIALGAGVGMALLAVLLSFVAFIRIWQEGRQGLGSAIKGLAIAALVLAYPALMAFKAATLPPIHDISTDTDNPPAYSRSRISLDARGGRVPPDAPPEVREAQRQAYVQIAPLTLDVGPTEAFALVQKAATTLGWQVVEAIPPGGRQGAGRLEAVARTFVLRLPDDVTVRIRPRADGSRIDIRSVSRVVQHDLGGNAARIRAFLEETSNLALAGG
ncbi:DUF1499 domain-containing protein [Microvirga antarctica]|uniref:DUF1499 domain-containing protein n=1 Tax=Microvirga antarctica TaxID=2819233 RepID=UPI001B317931|nr:DUF1499 domain-containing protein [Microvirga antarctica]